MYVDNVFILKYAFICLVPTNFTSQKGLYYKHYLQGIVVILVSNWQVLFWVGAVWIYSIVSHYNTQTWDPINEIMQ